MKRLLNILLFWMTGLIPLLCQQEPNFSHYKINAFLYNPAIAGAEGFTSFQLLAKEQLTGFDMAPSTQTLSAQTRLLKQKSKLSNPVKAIFGSKSGNTNKYNRYRSKSKGRVGLGAFVYHDQIGLLNNTGLELAYSYHVFFRGAQISFGLGSSFTQFRLNENRMVITDPNDPLSQKSNSKMLIPDANLGMFLLTRNYYIGISANHLLESNLQLGNKYGIDYHNERIYSFTAGGIANLSEDLIVEPTTIVKYSENNYLRADLNLTSKYKNLFQLGFSYRTSNELIVLTGVYIKSIYIGYAFDYPLGNNIGKYSYGAHEIAIAYQIGSSQRRYRYQDRF